MGKSSPRWALLGFRALAPSIYIKEAPRSSSSVSSTASDLSSDSWASRISTTSPSLILLTSWTGADPRHVVKYTKRYHELYPYATVMVITTVIQDLVFRSAQEKVAALAPAVEFLRRHVSTQLKRPTMLLHAFSEGGSNKAVCLAQAYLDGTGCRLPIGAFVFDSTPGKPHFSSNVAAFKRSLPSNKAIRAVGVPVGIVVLGAVYGTFHVIKGYENNVICQTRNSLNDETLWDVAGTPRTYVFSEADDLIVWEDIVDHAQESAELLGIESALVRFKKSGHCNHVRENEQAYWAAVVRTWEAQYVGQAF
ncbi:hypothetical protein CGRA01v4_09450 [Colletotrichum graminicola]|uniref:Indole-diterpene biosynthesis protein PaxU n=1 Tax=Colletotrichum graminicola (strain M1.001 / M2 / FGSC 10212) TaxID=645133 RepID=E3QVV5_COLGM|nr:uncharacterized protein GLRG_10137 [Colletotrichum graminicola M1.001]EFQ34993.1 hypothetical protein GLRG_10137 [Colletotrichum graminicola M1.001]WDK18165.1 hypothetical protein CGRA01v4_09450 [Colletotrichum graminicola]